MMRPYLGALSGTRFSRFSSKIDCAMFIERPSKNFEGQFKSMNADTLSENIPDTDILFDLLKGKGIFVGCIGDGGNETGMGLVGDQVINNIANGGKIVACTIADALIISAVSNWGCYAICGGLSMSSKRDLMPSVDEELEHIKRIVDFGAVDGCTKLRTYSVDGYSLDENMKVLKGYTDFIFNQFISN